MKYTAVLVATLAAGAMARAVPDVSPITQEQNDIAAGKITSDDYKEDEYKKDDYKKDDYKKDDYKKDDYKKDDYKKDSYKKDDDYKNTKEYKDYEVKQQDYDNKYYTPVEKNSYDYYMDKPEHKYYSEKPKDYDVSKSCYDKFYWPTNIHKEKSCQIKWQPKHGGEWKKDDETVVYLYHCKDYSKPKEKVCDECGHGDYKDWKPSSDCESSDSEGGAMYRFKFCKKGKEDEYTWGEEFPIYGDKYDDKKEAECPPPAPVPECPEAPPTPPPVKEVYPAPEAPATPAPEAAPAAPAPAPEAAPAAPAPEYPPAVAPQQGVANETTLAPVYPGAAGAIRASVSVIVGVAALITFAL